MNSAIITEGVTDYIFIQYFMRRVYSWNDGNASSLRNKDDKIKARELKKNDDVLTVIASGGCSRIGERLDLLLTKNKFSSDKSEFFSKIVIITDNDDDVSATNITESINKVIKGYDIEQLEKLEDRKWFNFKMKNGISEEISVSILLLLIPFEENGALETFLLNAIAAQDDYDKRIIDCGNNFVENIDSEKRYLKHRKDITKAEMDVYFSVRTSAEQFTERSNILKNIEWEKYEEIQNCFSELKKI